MTALLARFALAYAPYILASILALWWLLGLYAYDEENVAPHAKWAIPLLLVYATFIHLKRKP